MDENKFVNKDNQIRVVARMETIPVPFDNGRQVFFIKTKAPDHENTSLPVVLYDDEKRFILGINKGDKVVVYGRVETKTILNEDGSHQTKMFIRFEKCLAFSQLSPIVKAGLRQDDVGIAIGKIVKTPEDLITPTGRKIKRFILKVQKNDGTDRYNTIPFSLHGRLAESCATLFNCGQKMVSNITLTTSQRPMNLTPTWYATLSLFKPSMKSKTIHIFTTLITKRNQKKTHQLGEFYFLK